MPTPYNTLPLQLAQLSASGSVLQELDGGELEDSGQYIMLENSNYVAVVLHTAAVLI